MKTVRWLMLLMYWGGGGKQVQIYVDSEAACHRAAAQINEMLYDHAIAEGRTRAETRDLLQKDYTCIPTK